MSVTIHEGHVLDLLAAMRAGSARTCVTSPPYWGLRDYGVPPQEWPAVDFSPMPGLPPMHVPAQTVALGLEDDPWAFVAHMVALFREVRRVLADDGTLWLNLGDSYHGGGGGNYGDGKSTRTHAAHLTNVRNRLELPGLKPKDLVGIPWRVAFALQADGWYLRMDNVWAKPNPMPESVRDRPTKAHEYVFLLSKAQAYYYDIDATREPHLMRPQRRPNGRPASPVVGPQPKQTHSMAQRDETGVDGHPLGRNKRSVWTVATQPFPGAHFAVFPEALPETCIRAGSAPGDVVLDPFSGAGTTGLVARKLGRSYVGCELNPDYAAMARARIAAAVPMTAEEMAAAGLTGQVGLFGKTA